MMKCKAMKMDDEIIQKAFEEAEAAFALNEIPVGAVIFNTETKEILCTAHNETEKSNDVSAHAEIVALRRAGDLLKRTHLNGYSCFSTLEPCPMCASALCWAQVDRIYFGAYDPKSGGVEHGPHVVQTAHHKPDVYGGIEEARAAELMQNFFERLRK